MTSKSKMENFDGIPRSPKQLIIWKSQRRERLHCCFKRLLTFPSVHASGDTEGNGNLKLQNNFTEWDAHNHIDLNETGWDRIRQMFSSQIYADRKSKMSPDLEFITKVTSRTFALTFIITAAFAARDGKATFIEKNQGEKFKTKFLANRKMHDYAIKAGLTTGLKYGLKATFVTGSFMTVSHSIAAYRNKSSPFEYSVGGAVVMGIWRSYYGVRGMIAGSIIGGTFGLIFGVAAYGLLKAAGFTQEQRHLMAIQEKWEQQHAWRKTQQESAQSS